MNRLHFASSTIAPFTYADHVHGNAPHPTDYTKYLVEIKLSIHDRRHRHTRKQENDQTSHNVIDTWRIWIKQQLISQ